LSKKELARFQTSMMLGHVTLLWPDNLILSFPRRILVRHKLQRESRLRNSTPYLLDARFRGHDVVVNALCSPQ